MRLRQSPSCDRRSRSESSSSSSESDDQVSLRKNVEDYEGKQSWIREAMENITAKVDGLLEKVGASASVDVTDCNNDGYIELEKKLDVTPQPCEEL